MTQKKIVTGQTWCGIKAPRPLDIDASRLVVLASYARWCSGEVVVVVDVSAQPSGSSPLFVFSADPAAGGGAPTAISSLLVPVVAIVPGLQQKVKVQSCAHSIIHWKQRGRILNFFSKQQQLVGDFYCLLVLAPGS